MPETLTSDPVVASPFWRALALVQSQLPMIGRDTEGQAGSHRYKYAPLDTIWPKIRQTLAEHQLVWTCVPTMQSDRFVMQYTLMHAPSNDGITGYYPLADGRPQDIGSALTYARRYALCAVLGLVVSGDDDDAQTAQNPAPERRTEPRAGDIDGAISMLLAAPTWEDLQAAWREVGKLGLAKDPMVTAAKDKRKADLS